MQRDIRSMRSRRKCYPLSCSRAKGSSGKCSKRVWVAVMRSLGHRDFEIFHTATTSVRVETTVSRTEINKRVWACSSSELLKSFILSRANDELVFGNSLFLSIFQNDRVGFLWGRYKGFDKCKKLVVIPFFQHLKQLFDSRV